MNQRIRELAERAGGFPLYPEREEGDVSMGFRERALERFAELIVRECASRVQDTDLEDVEGGDSAVLDAAAKQLKKHFGVR